MPRRGNATDTQRCASGCVSCERLRQTLREILGHRTWPELSEDQLARAAGVSPAAFSAHYPDVAACAADALDEAISDLTATCANACAAAFPTARNCTERFLAVADAAQDWLTRHPAMARLLFVIPEQAHNPVLLDKVNTCKHVIAARFEDPSHSSPAGSTHVEFMVGLFFHAARRHLLAADSPGALRDQVLALASFTHTPRLLRPVITTEE